MQEELQKPSPTSTPSSSTSSSTYSFQVIGAIIIFIIGLIIARWISNITLRICERNEIDVTLRLFISNCVRLLFIAMIVVICLGKFGISVAPFVAAIGAISLSAGLALQGVFSNYGAGFTIVLTRPFVVGNTITINEITGVVEEIKLAYTLLSTEDGEIITIPNKHIVGEVITNSFGNKVVEASIGISYSADANHAIEVVRNTLAGFNDDNRRTRSTGGYRRFWRFIRGYRLPLLGANAKRYFEVQYQVNLALYNAFKEEGIEIPFPQREVTLKNSA